MITIKYLDQYFILAIAEREDLLEECQDFSYDEVCENEYSQNSRFFYNDEEEEKSPCFHEYNRCRVIKNIEKGDFNLERYLNSFLQNKELNNNNKIATQELLDHLLSILYNIEFREYLDYSTDRGYYGESFHKKVYGIDQLIDSIEEAVNNNKELGIELVSSTK